MGDNMQPRHPDITVQLTGQDGNPMAIIATVTQALRRHGYGADVYQFVEDATASDYNHVITTAMEWVNVK